MAVVLSSACTSNSNRLNRFRQSRNRRGRAPDRRAQEFCPRLRRLVHCRPTADEARPIEESARVESLTLRPVRQAHGTGRCRTHHRPSQRTSPAVAGSFGVRQPSCKRKVRASGPARQLHSFYHMKVLRCWYSPITARVSLLRSARWPLPCDNKRRAARRRTAPSFRSSGSSSLARRWIRRFHEVR